MLPTNAADAGRIAAHIDAGSGGREMLSPVSDQVRLFPSGAFTYNDAFPIVSGLVWRHRTTLITGASKTQLALQLAHAVASGQPFLGMTVTSPLPVLYICQRLRPADLAYRLRNLALYFGAPKAVLHHVSTKGGLIGEKEIRVLMEEHRPGLLVLDSLLLDIEITPIIRHFGCAVALVHPCPLTADTTAVVSEDEEDSSDYPTFTLLVKGDGHEQSFKIRRIGAVFKHVS
jgi:AAA domain